MTEPLVNAGIIKDTIFHLASGVKKKLPAKSIPEILYEFGSINKDALEKITRKRIEKVVCQLLFWQDGDFQFEPDDIDPKGKVEIPDHGWELSKGMSPEYLLVEGARVHDESSQTRLVSTEELTGFKREEAEWEGEWGSPAPAGRKKGHIILKGSYTGTEVSKLSFRDNPAYSEICKRYIPEGYPFYGWRQRNSRPWPVWS